MKSIQIGDVVRLNSGGPKMTVDLIRNEVQGEEIVCTWFDGTAKKFGLFVRGQLMPVQKD